MFCCCSSFQLKYIFKEAVLVVTEYYCGVTFYTMLWNTGPDVFSSYIQPYDRACDIHMDIKFQFLLHYICCDSLPLHAYKENEIERDAPFQEG